MRSIRILAVIAVLFTAFISSARGAGLNQSELRSIRNSADYIVKCQLPNGLIAQTPDEQIRAVPYFASIACIGLLRAYWNPLLLVQSIKVFSSRRLFRKKIVSSFLSPVSLTSRTRACKVTWGNVSKVGRIICTSRSLL